MLEAITIFLSVVDGCRNGHKKRATRVGRPREESDVRARLMKSAPRREGIGVGIGPAVRAGRPITDHERARRRLGRTERPSEGGCGEGVEGACHRGNSYLAFARVTESFTDCK